MCTKKIDSPSNTTLERFRIFEVSSFRLRVTRRLGKEANEKLNKQTKKQTNKVRKRRRDKEIKKRIMSAMSMRCVYCVEGVQCRSGCVEDHRRTVQSTCGTVLYHRKCWVESLPESSPTWRNGRPSVRRMESVLAQWLASQPGKGASKSNGESKGESKEEVRQEESKDSLEEDVPLAVEIGPDGAVWAVLMLTDDRSSSGAC